MWIEPSPPFGLFRLAGDTVIRFVASIGLVLLLAGGAVFAFKSGMIGGFADESRPVEVSLEAAESAELKLERLVSDRTPARLSDIEVTSLLRYKADTWSLASGSRPEVSMSADTIYVRGSIGTDRLSADPSLDAIRLLLPDTARVGLSGTIDSAEDGTVVLRIAALEVEGMPIPPRYVPTILDRIGYPQRSDIDSDAIEIPLPASVGSARIENGELVLTPDI